MLKNYTILIFVMAIAVLNGYTQKATDKSADETAIRANVEQMVNGWNAKSGEDFAKPFAADADYVVINGMHIKNRGVISGAHQRIFDTIYKDIDIKAAVKQIRFLRPDVAVVHTLAESFSKIDKKRITQVIFTLVMIKDNGKWEIAAFQNTEIQPAADK